MWCQQTHMAVTILADSVESIRAKKEMCKLFNNEKIKQPGGLKKDSYHIRKI